MGTIADKLLYLDDTREQILQNINALGGELTEEDTFRSYAEELDNIWEDQPQVVGEGTSLSLDNTKKAGMKTQLKGNTYQETTTGANLQKYTARTYSSGGTQYTCASNGQVTITGTGTGQINNLAYNQIATESMTLEAGTYTLKVIGDRGTTGIKVMGTSITSGLDENQEYTFTLNETTTDFYVSFFVNTGSHNENFYVTLASGTTATTERYTYGASPNPNYPQKVHTVSGDNTLRMCGKNLLPFTNQDFSYRGIRFYVQNGSLYIDGTATSEISSTYSEFKDNFSFTLQPGTYTIERGDGVRTYLYDENNTAILENPNYINANTPRTFTLSKTTKLHVGFYLAKNTVINNVNIQIMLEVGSTASTYEAYTGTTYPINLTGENIFDKDNVTYTDTVLNDSGVETSSTTSGHTTSYTKVEPNTTYTIQGSIATSSVACRIYYFDSTKTWISRTTTHAIIPFSFTTPNDCYYMQIQYARSVIDFSTIKVEKGSTATDYTAYGVPSLELCKIGDYEDKFFKAVNGDKIYDALDSTTKESLTYGKWYLQKNVGKTILTGAESETWNIDGDNRYVKLNEAYGHNTQCYSDLFTYTSETVSKFGYIKFGNSTNNLTFMQASVLYNTAELWRNWLSTHNTTVYYGLATPTYIELIDSLQRELDDIYNAHSYKGQTNILQENNDLPFIINARALMDANTVISNLEDQIEVLS